MKKQFLSFALLLVCFFSGINVSAQNYQPFRKGLTYHYIAQDSIYSMRIDSAKVVNGDSVFVFNPIARKGGPSITNCPVPPALHMEYAVHPNNQFGAQMLKLANGDYVFKTYQGAHFLLKTKAAIGQSWTAIANPAITATLTSRTFEPVKNNVSDSVLTFTLSNGKTIKLSKNYGFLKAPNLSQYSDAYFKPKDLEFYALPEKGLGNTISSPFAIYDFQPGDKFGYHYQSITQHNSVCSESWERREIKTRTSSPNGDTIFYTIETQTLSKSYGNPSAPWGFCQTPTTTTLFPKGTYTLKVYANSMAAIKTLSNGFVVGGQLAWRQSPVSKAIVKKAQFHNREQMHFNNLAYDTCSKTFSSGVDYSFHNIYAVGLGETRSDTYSTSTETTILECYTKGSETYGNCRSLAQILAVEEDLQKKPLVHAFPNPFSNELILTFGEASANTQLTLRNTFGQIVWEKVTQTAANSELKLQIPELPKGIYVLQASQNGKTFTTRLVKQ